MIGLVLSRRPRPLVFPLSLLGRPLLLLLVPLTLPAFGFGKLASVQPLQIAGTTRTFCTAFSIDEKAGLWATANHCVEAMQKEQQEFTVGGYQASPAFQDAGSDLAIVLSKAHAKAFALADEAPQVKDVVWVAGFPYGLPSVIYTKGRIAAKNVPVEPWGIADILDLTVGRGNSGSPVLKDGKVVGVLVGRFIESEHAISVRWETVKRLTESFYHQ